MTLDPRVTGVRGYWISQSSWQSYSSQFESIMFAFGSYINVPLGFLISLAWTPYSSLPLTVEICVSNPPKHLWPFSKLSVLERI